MWTDFQAQSFLGGIKAVGSYIVASRQARADRAWQKFNNTMTRLQDARNQNALTVNENMLVERSVRESFALSESAYKTQGAATAAAAAVGAEGNSVDRVMLDLQRNETRAQQALATDFEYQAMGIQQQREASHFQTEMQIDYKQIPKPNIAQSLLEFGGQTAVNWWESKSK